MKLKAFPTGETVRCFQHLHACRLFISTPGVQRADALRNVTLLYEDGPVGSKTERLTLMQSTLSSLRFLRGLRKLHILVPHSYFWDRSSPTRMEGVEYLFKFRKLEDVQVLGPHTGRRQDPTGPAAVVACAKRLDVIFRHFNYGLQLAQEGQVVSELYTNEVWADKEEWPALGTETSSCGRTKGCSCGQSSNGEERLEGRSSGCMGSRLLGQEDVRCVFQTSFKSE
jgi:hypothetical protein